MIWQRFWKYRGLMVIMLWQAAPPVTVTESGGRVQYGFGYGQGRIDDVIYSGGGCDSYEPVTTRHETYRPRSAGVSISKWTSARNRLGAALAVTSADTTSLSGVDGKAIWAREWKLFGLGAGVSVGRGVFLPGVYMRAGPLDKLHLRAELPDVSLPVSSTGVGRAGLAYNQTDVGFGAFVGIPLCYTSCAYGKGGPRADLRIPIGRAFDLNVSGFKHSTDSDGPQTFWGMAVGGQVKR